MTALQAALEMYRTAAREAWQSWKRSWWAIFFLLAALAARHALLIAMAPFGFAGSLVVGTAEAALAGWYLALVRIAVLGRRRMTWKDVRENAGKLFSETISVLFLFFIARLVIRAVEPRALLVLLPVANFAFNPVPELIYLGREAGMELVRRAWGFMKESWPEWLAANLLVIGLVCGLLAGLGLASLSAQTVISTSQIFGPSLGFMALPTTLLAAGNLPLGAVLCVLAAAGVHAFMLFRGHLFQALARGSRRSREWQQRTRR